MSIVTTYLTDAEVNELAEDDRILGPITGGGWFFGYESDHGESGLTGPFCSEQDAREAAKLGLREAGL